MKMRSMMLGFAGLMLTGSAHAQMLNAHPGGSGMATHGAGIFFNLKSIGGQNLSVTGFDFQTWTPGANVDVTVFTRPGGFAGHTADPQGWVNHGTSTLAATTGLSGFDFIDTADFALRSGRTTGVYLHVGSNGIGYSTSAQSSFRGRFIDDGSLQLEAGVSRSALFGGSQYGVAVSGPYRGFAGNIYYQPLPAPAGIVMIGLAGLFALCRRR